MVNFLGENLIKKRVYVASPFGFSESGREFLEKRVHPTLESIGLEVVSPWELTLQSFFDEVQSLEFGQEKKEAWEKLNSIIANNNKNGILSSDFVFALLDGVDVDSGTASEIGFAYAMGKKIIGYRSDFRYSGDNEGAIVNLQVEYFIKDSGGEIINTIEKDSLAKLF